MSKDYAVYAKNETHIVEHNLGAGFKVVFHDPFRHETKPRSFLSYKDIYFPKWSAVDFAQFNHWLSSFCRNLMLKDKTYHIGDSLSLQLSQDEGRIFLMCTVHLVYEDKLVDYDIYLDKAECHIILNTLQFLLNYERKNFEPENIFLTH